ncbi:MAG: PQQ-binding-like beta-propeller repeat protein [Phycisphaerales bacterium JB058]
MPSLGGCAKQTILTADERSARLPIVHSDWRKMGYRWDWNAFPVMLEGESPLRSEPHGELVVFQETGGTISGIDDRVGETIWSNKPAGDLTKFTGMDRRDEFVFVSSESELFALDSTTGELVNRQRFEKLLATDFVMFGDQVVVGTSGGEVMGHYLPAGIRIWGHDMPGTFDEDLVSIGSVVGGVTSTGRVICVDPITQRQTGLNSIFEGPGAALAASDDLMFVPSLDQSLYAFRGEDARVAWRHLTPSPITEAPVYHEGVLYCSLADTGLTAFDAQSGKVLWVSEGQFGEVIGIRNGRLMVFDGVSLVAVEPQRGVVLDKISLSNVYDITTSPFVDGPIYLTSREGVVAKFVPVN